MNITCNECNTTFERDIPSEFTRFILFKICQKCLDAKGSERRFVREKEAAAAKANQWLDICPKAFQDTKPANLPFPVISNSVLAWKYGHRGLILYGKTRSGKTRTAWLLVKKQFEAGRTARVMDSMSGFEYAAIFGAGGQAALDWVQSRSRCSLLFLDDVFKVKLTESFEAAMFAIVDYRLSHNLPIIATLNDTGETLAARMTNDRGDAFIARLKEMCETIVFK